jgi:hypothetical protein
MGVQPMGEILWRTVQMGVLLSVLMLGTPPQSRMLLER